MVFLLSNLSKYFVAGAARHGRDVQREQASDVPPRRRGGMSKNLKKVLPVAGALLLPRTSSMRSQPNP